MAEETTLSMVSPDDPNVKLGRYRSTLDQPQLQKLGTDPKLPNYESDFHFDQKPRWRMIDALWDGTEGMRVAGKALLTRYEKEGQEVWQRRLDNAVLLNYFRKTVEGYVGKPFGRPLEVPDDAPPDVEEMLKDVDGRGTTFDQFANRAFEKGMAKGIVHALVDFPPAEEGDTAADEQLRTPVLIIVEPENLIGARCDEDGCPTQVRLREVTVEPDGAFGERTVTRIRVIEQDKWELWRLKGRKWIKEDEGPNTLGEVPLVTFYADREGFMRSRPPLLDLAFKNVEHWRSSSDQRNILTVSRFPILVGSGINPKDPMEIGPNQYIGLRAPEARMMYVETTGASIAAGRQDLEDLKAEMAVLGLTMLMPSKPGDVTATAKAIDGAESITELQRIVMNFEQFLNEVVKVMARWMDHSEDEVDDLPRVKINGDWAKLLNVDAGIQALMTARSGRDISRKALLEALKRRNYLPQEFDPDEDAEQLAEEASQTGAAGGMPPAKPGPGLLGDPTDDAEGGQGDDPPNPGEKPAPGKAPVPPAGKGAKIKPAKGKPFGKPAKPTK